METTTKHLLIVEDDPEMGMGLEDFFEIKGYHVTRATDGDQATHLVLHGSNPYDLILLDVMLPKRSGLEVLRAVRSAGIATPVVMLTAKGREQDKLTGFELGADDYVTKPFSAEELAARVRAVLKRSTAPDATMEVYRFGDVEINFSNHTVTKGREELKFTALEFNIMKYFIEHRGRTVSRKQLLRDVWQITGDITTRTIDRHIASIRKKIEPDEEMPTYIETVYGIGYKFVG